MGDETRWPDAALSLGPVRISGAVQRRASWHAVRDRLGWTTVALVGRPDGSLGTVEVEAVVRAGASRCLDPVRMARALWQRFQQCMDGADVGILRIGPHGRLVELLNVSLPGILHWSPTDGLAPFEPVGVERLFQEHPGMSDMIRLEPGSLLLGATGGVLPHDAGWRELNCFTRSLSVDLFGGQLADAPPAELARLLRVFWIPRSGPRAIVAVGLPQVETWVA